MKTTIELVNDRFIAKCEPNGLVKIGNETEKRSEAITKYLFGMCCCDGSEQTRYTNIFLDLLSGMTNIEY